MTDFPRLGVIGAGGWLGGAIVQAVLQAGLVSPGRLTLSSRGTPPARFPGAIWTRDNQELAESADVILVCVRPADWPAVNISEAGKLVISVMAGIPLERLAKEAGTDRVVRAMPNAAAEVSRSYTSWAASPAVTAADRSTVKALFDACGVSDEVPSEWELDYLTGLSGSGPAFPVLLADALMRDAIARGLNPSIARRAVTTVLIGTGRLLEANAQSPSEMVQAFVGYGGTTAAAIKAMRSAGFDDAVREGLSAALRRAAELGKPS